MSLVKSGKRNDIQVMRAIAVIAVVVFHLDESWLVGGFLGVDVFFVISGFLITGILIRSLEDATFSLPTFYLRRIKRLFPALALVLWVTVLVGIACLPPIPFRGLVEHLPWAALQVSNFSFMGGVDYFGADTQLNPVLHTWSLGVEEQFYLTWAPLLLMVFSRGRKRSPERKQFRPYLLLCVVVGIGFVAEIVTRSRFGNDVAFFSPLSRSWQLGLGGLAALLFRSPRFESTSSQVGTLFHVSGGLMIVLSCCFLSPELCTNPVVRFIPCMGAFLALLFPFAHRVRFLTPLLRSSVYVGDISYSLYLWHWPVICLMPFVVGNSEPFVLLVTTILTFLILASVSYHFCEKPFMQKTTWNRFFSLRSATVITLLCMVAGGAFALRSEGSADWRFESGNTTSAEKAYRAPPSFRRIRETTSGVDPLQLAGEAEVLLIGDSHARHFAPVVRAWAEENNQRFFTFWLEDFFSIAVDARIQRLDDEGRAIGYFEKDRKSAKHLFEEILNSKSVTTVFIAHRTEGQTQAPLADDVDSRPHVRVFYENNPALTSNEAFGKQAGDYVSNLLAHGKNVVLLGQAPLLRKHPRPGASLLDQVLGREWRQNDIYLPADLAKRGDLEHRVYQALSEKDGVYYLPTRQFVTRAHSLGGEVLYDDNDHLSYKGAMFLKEALFELLQPLRIP